MSTKHIYLDDLHKENLAWLSEIQLYKEELSIFESRLEEVVIKNTDKDVLAKLESFQNRLIRHKEVADTIQHDIKIHEQSLVEYAKENPVALDRKYFEDHPNLRESIETERKIFAEMKEELTHYLAKVM